MALTIKQMKLARLDAKRQRRMDNKTAGNRVGLSLSPSDALRAVPALVTACRGALELRNLSYLIDANSKAGILDRRAARERIEEIETSIRAALLLVGAEPR